MRNPTRLPICRTSMLFLLLIFSSFFATAQQPITGKITDAQTKEPVANASVLIKGKSTGGTTTDDNGAFSINASPGDRLVITSTEYAAVEVPVGDAGTVTVQMNRLVSNLNEVVVIGYGTVRKKDLTGAVTSLKGSEMKAEGIINVSRALQGKMPGVTIESAGGDPGTGTRILIRGVGTLGNASPLYLVDGVPAAGINNISPADIESVDVLKDASAAAIYGSRAANGVVLITTKTGKPGKPVITFNTNLGVQKLAKKYDVLNAEEWATVNNAAHDAAGLPRLAIAANPSQLGAGTDWQDAIFRSAALQQYNLSVSGGSQTSRYSISGEYNDQQGIVDVTGYKRYGMRAKSETTKGRLKIGETILLSREKFIRMPGGWGGQGGNPVGSAVKMIPVFNIYDTAAIGGYGGAYGPVVNVANPVAQLNMERITYELTSLLANAFAEVTILPSLKYKFNLGYTSSFGNTDDYYKRNKERNVLVLLENTLHYNQDFGKHSVQALAGYTYQRFNYNYLNAAKTNLPDGVEELDAGAGTATVNGNSTESVLLSMLGRVIYSYDNRYLLTASFRRDGSSRFNKANRYGNFPSIALGWNVSNESFFKSFPNVLSTLKLRGSFGILGNQEIGDYQYNIAISSNVNYVTGEDQHKWFGAIQTAFVSPIIKWENTRTFNAGFDAGLFNNSLSITADYFIKRTTDVLLNVPVPGSTGSATNPVVNAGTLQNKGLELGLNYSNSLGKINYSVFGSFTAVKNKVIKLGTGTQQIFGGQPTHHGASTTLTQAGGEVSGFYLIKTLGIFQSQQEVDAYVDKNGRKIQPNASPGDIKFFDANEDGIISNSDRVDGGSPFPNFEYGFGIKASAYQFDLNVFIQGTSGNMIYNGLRQDMESMNLEFNYSKATLNAWTPQNRSNMPRAVNNDPNFNNQSSTRFLEKASYLRMRTLQIGYTIPEPLVQKLKITSLRAYLSADNLFTITNYSGFNPDIGRAGNILDRGVDYGHVAYPIARVLSVGIQLSL
jgi:TonB-dependent starch-binding outer membrane protein SusC